MGSFFTDILRGLSSGTALGVSTALFDLTALLFLVSTVAYLTYLAWRREGVWLLGYAVVIAGALCQTAALALRWIAAGWDHPPFTNLYESLVFFGWGIVVVHVVVEARYRIKVAGALVVPIAFLAMGIASLSPNKGIEPLMPALQDIWLHLHVFSASVGYAAFLVAFGFSVLFLVKDRLPLEYFGIACGFFVLFAVLAVTRGGIVFGEFTLTKVVAHGDHVERLMVPGTDIPAKVIIPLAGWLLLAASALFLAAVILLSLSPKEPGSRAARRAFTAFFAATFVFTLFLVHVFIQAGRLPSVSLRQDVYGIAFLVLAWLLAVLTLIIYYRREGLFEMLPEARRLDDLAYKSVIVAFPIMTFVIVSGAVWANKAWGRYWGWDPKETASLVTWGIYLLYLHARFTARWSGRRTALISIVGFASVVFTYLGVNLVLSGLHSYATG